MKWENSHTSRCGYDGKWTSKTVKRDLISVLKPRPPDDPIILNFSPNYGLGGLADADRRRTECHRGSTTVHIENGYSLSQETTWFEIALSLAVKLRSHFPFRSLEET